MDRFAQWSFPLAAAAVLVSTSTAFLVVDRLPRAGAELGVAAATEDPGSDYSFPDPAPSRLIFPVQVEPNSAFPNRMVSLTSNWHWSPDQGWTRPAAHEPSVALTMEPWFHGLSELNFDMEAPAGSVWPGGRAMGLAAREDGDYVTWFMGGAPFKANASGVKITGGSTTEPIIALQEAPTTQSLLRAIAPNQRTTVQLNGGNTPALSFGLAGESADRLGNGIVRSFGPLGQHALLNIVAPGDQSTILAVRDQPDDAYPKVAIRADGRIEWNEANAEPLSLAPANGELSAEGTFAATALRVGDGSILRTVRLISLEIAPEAVAKGTTHVQSFAAPGISSSSLVFVNTPSQPNGIVVTNARADGVNRVSLAFVNLGPALSRPAGGKYQFLVVDADP